MTMAVMSTSLVAVGSSISAITLQNRVGSRSSTVASMGAMRSSYAGASLKVGSNASAAPTFRRSSVVSVRMESPVKTGKEGPQSPSSPPGLSGTEVPLGGFTTSAPLEQKNIPVPERIAYMCQDCGYVYDLELPFEDQSEDYNCPVCTAPKNRFVPQNSTVDETLDVTKNEN